MIAIGGEVDASYMHFSNEVAKQGYTQAEKVVPSGFPSMLHQVTWRFRRPGDASTLLQVGPGLFSANALQPYRRWRDFRPTVELGIKALLATRVASEQAEPFSGVSLRYINAFSGVVLDGKHPSNFITDVLGLHLTLPKAIAGLVDQSKPFSSSANLLIPIANTSKTMSLMIGDGKVNADDAAMYDVTVAEAARVPCAVGDVMQALDSSRDIIHNCFLQLTKPVEALMKPQGGNRAT